jgi:hypothetical protein
MGKREMHRALTLFDNFLMEKPIRSARGNLRRSFHKHFVRAVVCLKQSMDPVIRVKKRAERE